MERWQYIEPLAAIRDVVKEIDACIGASLSDALEEAIDKADASILMDAVEVLKSKYDPDEVD